VRGPAAFDGAFHAMTAEHAQALLVSPDPLTFFHRRRLAELAIEARLPMMGSLPEYAEAGSLVSYWADTSDASRRAASYVDRILKGAKPGELPIEQPTKFELVANLKTARTLGITVPQSVLLRPIGRSSDAQARFARLPWIGQRRQSAALRCREQSLGSEPGSGPLAVTRSAMSRQSSTSASRTRNSTHPPHARDHGPAPGRGRTRASSVNH